MPAPATRRTLAHPPARRHPSLPPLDRTQVTDLILNMVGKAAKQDAAFLVDLASLQEKHVAAAKELLGSTKELSTFIARLLEDIGNLKAMLQAICIGEWGPRVRCWGRVGCIKAFGAGMGLAKGLGHRQMPQGLWWGQGWG